MRRRSSSSWAFACGQKRETLKKILAAQRYAMRHADMRARQIVYRARPLAPVLARSCNRDRSRAILYVRFSSGRSR